MTPTGSMRRAPRRSCSRSAGCSPTRSRSCSPCERGTPRCSTAPICRCSGVGGLDREVTLELLAREAGRAVAGEVAERMYEATAGNPLALLEVAPEAARLDRRRARGPGAGVATDHRGVPAPLGAAP